MKRVVESHLRVLYAETDAQSEPSIVVPPGAPSARRLGAAHLAAARDAGGR